jgi:hypothetical protein
VKDDGRKQREERQMRVAYQTGKRLFLEAEAEVEFLILVHVFYGVSNPLSDMHIAYRDGLSRVRQGLKGRTTASLP